MNSPLIISASRRTDIPAFYADWFMSRMTEGYCEYVNPFNQKPVRVDLSQTKCVVFWTKNPRSIMRHLLELDEMGIKYYFQYANCVDAPKVLTSGCTIRASTTAPTAMRQKTKK